MLRNLAAPAWAMMEYGWYPLLLFIATPWFLLQLGTEHYGLWMLLTATVGFGSLLNMGTSAATIKEVSAGIGRTLDNDIERTVKASLAIAMLGGSALALFVFSAFWFAGDRLLDRMGDLSLVRLTGAAATALIFLEQLDSVFTSAIKGAERFGQAASLEITSKTAQVLAAALTLLVWPNLQALYVTLLIVAAARLVTKGIVAKHLLKINDLRPSLTGTTEILRFAKWGWLQGIGGVLFGVTDRLLVASILGATSLTYYSIASQLALQVHAVTAAGVSVIFPKISRKLEAGNDFSLRRVAGITMLGNLMLSTTLAITLLLLGRQLLILWLGPAQAVHINEVLPYLVLAYWILAINATPHYVLLSLGRFRAVAISNLVAGVILIIAISMVAANNGLTGVAAARMLYGVIIMINILPLLAHLRGMPNR